MTKEQEELLIEARKRYPIGTKVNSLGGTPNVEVGDKDPYYPQDYKDVFDYDRIRTHGNCMIYVNGSWAPIVNKSVITETKEINNYLIY